MTRSKPKAVIISDIHYNINTIFLADLALRSAIKRANELQVPLIVAGDLHDTKANMRGECSTAMINTLTLLEETCYILRGNHDQINEKSSSHSLDFLKLMPNVYVIDTFMQIADFNFIPYQHQIAMFEHYLDLVPKGATIIMHQGVKGSSAGDYIQDPTAIDKELLADYRVISGHYHTRQDIKCGRPRQGAIGLMSYVGNPYTLNFGEANDPEKGFRVLNQDGTLDFVPTNLRKHIVIDNLDNVPELTQGDIVKVKLTDTKENLAAITKQQIASIINFTDFRLELIPLETNSVLTEHAVVSSEHTLDSLIDNLQNTSVDQKTRLKTLWKDLCA